ncbi:MAG: stage II sporulation protein M [Erythrobacter sp.]|nr:stage II sporulation protein M [Erythrobacter sp.]
MVAPADISAASLRSDRFRLEREVDWQRLEAIVTALEKNRPRSISDDDLLELPVLYRKTASSLAVARETSLDAATLAYLEALVRRAWFQIYGPRIGLFGWLRRFLGGGWSAAVRSIWLDICITFVVMVAGGVVGWLLVEQDESWFYSLLPGDSAGGRVPGADPAVLRETISTADGSSGLGVFAASLFSHNTAVTVMYFALGFAFGIPTLLLELWFMATIGAMLWVFFDAGMGWDFVAWLSIHGTTELGAALLGSAAGLHIGRTMAFPGDRTVMGAMRTAGVRAAQVMAGCTIMLIIAGMLEGFARQLVGDTLARFTIGGIMLAFWVLYFVAMPRPREHLA